VKAAVGQGRAERLDDRRGRAFLFDHPERLLRPAPHGVDESDFGAMAGEEDGRHDLVTLAVVDLGLRERVCLVTLDVSALSGCARR